MLSVWTHSPSHAGSGLHSITREISESLLPALSSLAGVLPCCCWKCCCCVKFAHFSFKWRLSRAVICQPRWTGLLFAACGDRRAGACYRRTEGPGMTPGHGHPGPGWAGTERPGALGTARSSLRIWVMSILLFWWLVPEREVVISGWIFQTVKSGKLIIRCSYWLFKALFFQLLFKVWVQVELNFLMKIAVTITKHTLSMFHYGTQELVYAITMEIFCIFMWNWRQWKGWDAWFAWMSF